MATTIQSTGLAASRTGTLLNTFFIKLQAKADDVAKAIGMSGERFKVMLSVDALSAIKAMLEGFGNMGNKIEMVSKLTEIFGLNAIRVIVPLISNLDDLNRNLETSRVGYETGLALKNLA